MKCFLRAKGGMSECKEGSERGSFDVEMLFGVFIKNAFGLYLELCLLPERAAHSRKNHENKWLEREKQV